MIKCTEFTASREIPSSCLPGEGARPWKLFSLSEPPAPCDMGCSLSASGGLFPIRLEFAGSRGPAKVDICPASEKERARAGGRQRKWQCQITGAGDSTGSQPSR